MNEKKEWVNPTIMGFQGEYRFLSNFWESPMEIDGIKFFCNEQWYVYNKTLVPEERKHILSLTKPGDIKRYGYKITLRNDWEEQKKFVMAVGLTNKFDQNPDLKQKLIDTYPYRLEESNKWGDSYWGVNYKQNLRRNKKLGGLNVLGKLLMDFRESYIKKMW